MNPFATSATSDAEVSLSMPSASEPMQPMGFQQPPTYQPPFQRNVCFFHVIFKALAIFVFLFQGFLHTGYIFTFVLVTLFSALDFWTVKNVTGRLLVGLRWHNHMDEDGKSRWRFESFEDQRFVHPTDSNIFWLGLFVPPVIWLLLAMGMVSAVTKPAPLQKRTAGRQPPQRLASPKRTQRRHPLCWWFRPA